MNNLLITYNNVNKCNYLSMTLGLVGPTGAGKSTLLRVLLRQATPQAGAVTWGGHPLEAYRLDALRAATSWVPQESFLFSASIAENIALARPGASGFPKFKSKKTKRFSYKTNFKNGNIMYCGQHIKLPKL
ncbi:ATP-binding cassette domain-containing protein [Clostridioides difficile]|uniref:ATP-binding cassette domain-containing protein n=1 Tax=Clostridioides difficile TaxID=1496 RepID=UPI0018C87617